MLRPGSITAEQIAAVLGTPVTAAMAEQSGALRAPGQLASHYAPNLPVRLNETEVQPDEALLAFGPNYPEGAVCVVQLSASGNLEEAAANLFAALRTLDQPTYRAIAVMSVPNEGVGVAINDRLQRAAADRG
jgi:L-threonylcarbamoyladenylate synthase